MIKIMIVDDDQVICSQLSKFLTNEQTISVINISHNGYDAIQNYIKLEPDILILDLKLPDITGLDVLTQLSEIEKNSPKKNVIILSGESQLINNVYKENKVYRYFVKPFDYTALLDTINEIFYNTFFEDDVSLYEYITDALWKLQFNVHSKGVSYLQDAIFTAYRKQYLLYHNKELMLEVAKNNKTNVIAVRSAIDKSISSMYRYTEINVIRDFFNDYYDGRKLSTKYFISLFVTHLNKFDNNFHDNCINL